MVDPEPPEAVTRLARAVGPPADDVTREMDDRAAREGFPTVGPEVGGLLAWLVGLTGARRVFEFGSGFGYSAYWVARGLPADGEVVLVDRDADLLADARDYLARGGYADRATLRTGDAVEVVEAYDDLDLVLVDNEKERYVEAFEAARPRLSDGAVVVADNATTAGSVDFDRLRSLVDGDDTVSPADAENATTGVAAYLDHVRAAEAFETVLVPLGEGLAISRRRD
ncbi:methyltransferase [Halobacteriales archaeon SW_12_71_31]|nr:MAG: methyltransferase [Halobacteriales archaeon SW_12_71_31]